MGGFVLAPVALLRRAVVLLAALALLMGMSAGAAQATPASTTVAAAPAAAPITGPVPAAAAPSLMLPSAWYPSGGKGTDVWTSYAYIGSMVYPVLYVRFSWSYMWVLRANLGSAAALASAMCGLLTFRGGTTVAACASAVAASYWYLRNKINEGIATKKCLRIRVPGPPTYYPGTFQATLVTCRL